MKAPRRQLAEIIAERTLQVRSLGELAKEIAAYLLTENRAHELESLMRDVMAYRQAHGLLEADVYTAHELGANVEHEVQTLLKAHYPDAKHVTVRTDVDPSVVGGLKVQMANEQLDLSVRAKLDTFKRLSTGGIK